MPARGERHPHTVRIPVTQNAHYEERAETLGIPIGSWIVLKLAESEGLPVPDYIQKELRKAEAERAAEAEREELPMARSA